MTKYSFALLATSGLLTFSLMSGAAFAAPRARNIGGAPLPPSVESDIYSSPSRAPDISASEVAGDTSGGGEAVSAKVVELRNQLAGLQARTGDLAQRLSAEEQAGKQRAADYYASVATINTQLQVGTTPGNPRLIGKLNNARSDLDQMSGSISNLNALAAEIGAASTNAQYLLQATQASYGLAGGVEEDRTRLDRISDSTNATAVAIDRLATNVNDDLTRTAAYVSVERNNLRTLSLAVQSGDLFGHSLANRSFAGNDAGMAPADLSAPVPASTPALHDNNIVAPSAPPGPAESHSAGGISDVGSGTPDGSRPLIKIKFDKPDVSYEQPLYTAVSDALNRYPNTRFQVVAVHPDSGNAAEVAIESTRARRDAERVLRSLTQMGLSLDRIDLSSNASTDAGGEEVRIFIHN